MRKEPKLLKNGWNLFHIRRQDVSRQGRADKVWFFLNQIKFLNVSVFFSGIIKFWLIHKPINKLVFYANGPMPPKASQWNKLMNSKLWIQNGPFRFSRTFFACVLLWFALSDCWRLAHQRADWKCQVQIENLNYIKVDETLPDRWWPAAAIKISKIYIC